MRCSLAMALLISAVPSAATAQAAYDTIIRGGTIVDGSGLASFTGDVAIRGGHIVAVGKLGDARAAQTIDARGLVVAPGFINIHSHARPDAVATPTNMLTQGVTTEIANADGHGTTDIAGQLAEFAAGGLGENIGLYIGFNAAWAETMGTADRRASAAEIARMRGILETNLAGGAWGVASGLDYQPAYQADADEVVAVVSVAKPWRTNFPNHDRVRAEEGYSSFKGMTETVSIAEAAGLVPVITHMKSQGAEQGNAPAVITMMDRASARGVFTAADVYPYLAGHASLSLMVPGWAQDGGREALLKRLADPAARVRIVAEVETAMTQRFGGPKGVRLLATGEELTAAMTRLGADAGETAMRLLERENYATILSFGREDDLVAFLKHRNTAMACDCGATTATKIHPRNFGSFPRVLGRYVRDTRALTMTDAVRKMTALPAAIVGMPDRGYLLPGMRADVTLFDPRTIRDNATYKQPTLPSQGVRHVFVGGRHTLRDGVATGAKGGAIVRRTRHMPSRPMTAANRRRSLAGSGSLGGAYNLSFAATQSPGARSARGTLRLTDRATGVVWTADRLGTIQTAPGWASLTATLRDRQGTLRAATLTVDGAAGGGAGSVLVLSLDGQAELTGTPSGPVRIAER